MDRNFYVFRSEWALAGPVEDVYLALAQLVDYPSWWPEVRSVRQVTAETSELVCRSLLPYDLVFSSRQTRKDPDARVLEAALEGDLAGFSRWTLTPRGDGTLAVFEEEVTAEKALLRRLGGVARPAFKANHTLMMRHGRQGLRTFLAGFRLGRSAETQT
jgi:Polyketide cyclase / dehydrase and lipid transport